MVTPDNLTDEERAAIEVAQADAAAALQEAGFSGQIDDLEDISAAFGPEGFGGKLINNISGIFGATAMPDTANAAATIKALKTVTTLQLVTAFPGIRDSVQLKTQIASLIPETGEFFQSKPAALRKFQQVKTALDQAIVNQTSIAGSTTVRTTDAAKANVALYALRPLSETYAKLLQSMEGDGKSGQVTGSVFKDGDLQPEAFNSENPSVITPSGTAPNQQVFVADFLRLNKDNPKATEIEALRQFKKKYPEASANKFTTSDGKTFNTGAEAAAHQATLGE
jgi:hypothetical protein